METMEIYNNISNGKDLAEKYGYPTMSVDNVKAIGVDSYDIPDRDLPPVLDPYSASERSKAQIPSLSERIKNTVKTNYYDDMKHMSPLGYMTSDQSYKGRFNLTGPEISLEDSRYRLSSGTWIPKYESYIPGVDNDTRLSRSQGRTEKWMRGLGKFVGKTALYGLGGVIQPFKVFMPVCLEVILTLFLTIISRDGWMIRIRKWITVLLIITIGRSGI